MFMAALVLFALGSSAQQSGRWGLKAGSNLYSLYAKNDKTRNFNHAKFGFTTGLTYEIPLTRLLSIQPELDYSYQRANEDYYRSTLKLHYTQVPVLFRYHLPENPVAFYAGPQVAFLSGARVRSRDGITSKVGSQFNRTDFGIAWGLGMVPLEGSGFTADIRVYHSVMNTMKAEYDGGLRTRGTLLSVTVGYIFGH